MFDRLCDSLEDIADAIKSLANAISKPKGSNLIITLKGGIMQLATDQKVPYVVAHLDGIPLKIGNSIAVTSSDINGATIVPDATPMAGSLASGFVVAGTALQTGLKITANELDTTGAVVDTTSTSVDIVAATPPPPPPPPKSNLPVSLGVPVPKTATNFANPLG